MRHDTGEVLDYVGGQADLRAGLVRAIGEPDRRFREDKLRLLRAVRFAARFGSKLSLRRSMPYAGMLARSTRFQRSVCVMNLRSC